MNVGSHTGSSQSGLTSNVGRGTPVSTRQQDGRDWFENGIPEVPPEVTPASTMVQRRPNSIDVQQFSGINGDDLMLWIASVEMQFSYHKIFNEEDRIALIVPKLNGMARSLVAPLILQSFVPNTGTMVEYPTWESIKKRLLDHFRRPLDQLELRTAISKLRVENGNMAEYIAKFSSYSCLYNIVPKLTK